MATHLVLISERKCLSCLQILPLSEFHRCYKKPVGYVSRCKRCSQARAQTYYAQNRERLREQHRIYARERYDPELRRDRGRRHNERYETLHGIKRHVAYAQTIRQDVLMHYSGDNPQCACCGENHLQFLALDHVNGGGNKEKKILRKTGTRFFGWLKSHNYPSGYRVLCHNCNMSMGFYGFCPHAKQEIVSSQQR